MIERSLPAGPHHVVRVRFTDRADGDFHIDGPAESLADRRRTLVGGEWTWLRQVHGAEVVEVAVPGGGAGREADGSVTTATGAVLAVHTADCAPVVLAADGVVATAHVGWRGLVADVLGAVVTHVRDRGGDDVRALLGPCIHPAGYEFGEHDLTAVVAAVGPTARATTASGRPALDLPAAVRAGLSRAGVEHLDELGADTAGPGWFSHRTRGDEGRQVTVAWLETVAGDGP